MLFDKNHRLIGAKNINLYVKGGRGLIALRAPSGKYHLYQFRKPKDPENFDHWCLFAFAKGADGRWKYTGILKDDMEFKHTVKSKYPEDSEEFKGANYVVKMMLNDFNTPMEIYHGGRCSVCGKPLKNKYSLIRGMGYRCKRHLIEELRANNVK